MRRVRSDHRQLNSIPVSSRATHYHPFIFCPALVPPSTLLNDTGYGYKIQDRNITHLFCMDALKLFATDDEDLEKMLQAVKKFSVDMGRTLVLDKCAKASFKR